MSASKELRTKATRADQDASDHERTGKLELARDLRARADLYRRCAASFDALGEHVSAEPTYPPAHGSGLSRCV